MITQWMWVQIPFEVVNIFVAGHLSLSRRIAINTNTANFVKFLKSCNVILKSCNNYCMLLILHTLFRDPQVAFLVTHGVTLLVRFGVFVPIRNFLLTCDFCTLSFGWCTTSRNKHANIRFSHKNNLNCREYDKCHFPTLWKNPSVSPSVFVSIFWRGLNLDLEGLLWNSSVAF